MRKAALILSLLFLLSCGENIKVQRLSVEEGKRFEKFNFKKIWEINQWGGWCLACPQGIVREESLDKKGMEFNLELYDYSGKLKKKRMVIGGKGPDEYDFHNPNNFWVSSSGKILLSNNYYLKSIDPETLEIETLAKYSNVIEGYGSKYTFGRRRK